MSRLTLRRTESAGTHGRARAQWRRRGPPPPVEGDEHTVFRGGWLSEPVGDRQHRRRAGRIVIRTVVDGSMLHAEMIVVRRDQDDAAGTGRSAHESNTLAASPVLPPGAGKRSRTPTESVSSPMARYCASTNARARAPPAVPAWRPSIESSASAATSAMSRTESMTGRLAAGPAHRTRTGCCAAAAPARPHCRAKSARADRLTTVGDATSRAPLLRYRRHADVDRGRPAIRDHGIRRGSDEVELAVCTLLLPPHAAKVMTVEARVMSVRITVSGVRHICAAAGQAVSVWRQIRPAEQSRWKAGTGLSYTDTW